MLKGDVACVGPKLAALVGPDVICSIHSRPEPMSLLPVDVLRHQGVEFGEGFRSEHALRYFFALGWRSWEGKVQLLHPVNTHNT
jgi:hypothetical protein